MDIAPCSRVRFVRNGGNVPQCSVVTPVMANMDEVPLASAAECVTLLRRVLHCLDEVLPAQMPEGDDRLALAGAYIQQVVDLLDQP